MILSIFKIILISLKNIYNILIKELRRLYKNQYKFINIYNIIHNKKYFIFYIIFFIEKLYIISRNIMNFIYLYNLEYEIFVIIMIL